MSISGGILGTNFDYAKLFIGNNRFKQFTYTNPSGSTATLAKGTLMGLVTATNKLLPCASGATDGSQLPFAILQNDYSVAGNATTTLSVCVWGDVARELVVFAGTDTYTTPCFAGYNTDSPPDTLRIGMGSIENVLLWKGIYLTPTTENTKVDNA